MKTCVVDVRKIVMMVMQASCGPARAREDDTAVGRCGRRLMTSAILAALILRLASLKENFSNFKMF
jgi:hypothetical protein